MAVRSPTIYILAKAGELDGEVKIGFTSRSVRDRAREGQTFSAEPLVVLAETPGTRDDEFRLHRLFAPYRVKGEWFRYENEIRDLVAHLLDGADLRSWLEGRDSFPEGETIRISSRG